MAAPLGLTIRSNLVDMQIGDCIPCRYTASTSGVAGYFSELGTCTATEIPVTGTATPDGLFYFIKVAKGLLIADRNLQTSISWDVLNTAKFIEGNSDIKINMVPIMTSATIPSGIATASSEISGGYEAFYAFNQSNNWQTRNGVTSGWISYEFPNKTVIDSYMFAGTLNNTTKAPRNWTFEGSNDNNNWTILDTRTGIGGTSNLVGFSIQSPGLYKSYRMNITANNGGTTIELGFLSLIQKLSSIPLLIRSLSGGCAYADANGNMSITNEGLGAFPTINEWDTYIVKNTLGGKITPGDNNIWHWKSIQYGSWCKDTPISSWYANTNRIVRGSTILGTNSLNGVDCDVSSGVRAQTGFRPVLEYIEPNGSNKQTNLWY